MEQGYIAFISYRHTAVDMAAAVKIQQMIERYKIPKKLQKGRNNKLGMVFRDEDELNISANLSDELCHALDSSEYLLVICTPQYKESKWCLQEISYFLKNHDIDHVLPILVSGTPKESFPDELFQRKIVDGKEMISEPLAANVAADTIKEIEKNISHEYLRIVARMLECNYDELVQRQKRYERRRMLGVFSSVLVVMLAFIGMLLVKNRQINEQYQAVRQNQARNQAVLSLEQYQRGDRLSAIQSAIAVLPEGRDEGPVVPEQINALSTATNAYNTSYVPVSLTELTDGDHRVIADDLKHYYIYSDESLQMYSLPEQELLYTFRLKDFVKSHPEMDGIWMSSAISGVEHIDDNSFFMKTGGSLFYIDTRDAGSVQRIYYGVDNIDIIEHAQDLVAICNYAAELTIIDIKSAEIVYQHDFNENADESGTDYRINSLSWNEQGTSLAIGFGYELMSNDNPYHFDVEKNKLEEAYFKEHPPYGTVLLEPVSGKLKTLSSKRTEEVCFEADAIAAEHFEYPDTIIKTHPMWTDPITIHFASIYSVVDDQCFFTTDTITALATNSFGSNYGTIDYDNESTQVYTIWLGNEGAVIDASNHEILFMDTFNSDIRHIGTINDYNIDFVLSNGSIQHMHMDENRNLRTNRLKLDLTVNKVWARDGLYHIRPEGTDTLICCKETDWEGYTTISASDPLLETLFISDIQYEAADQETFRVVKYQHSDREYKNTNVCSGFEIYPTNSEKVLFTYLPQDPDGIIEYIAVAKDGSAVTIVEQTATFETIISRFSLVDGTFVCQYKESETEKLKYDSRIAMSSDRSSLLWIKTTYQYQEVFCFYDFSETQINAWTQEVDTSVYSPIQTADDKYLVWVDNPCSDEEYRLAIYDLAEKEIHTMPVPDTFEIDSTTELMRLKDSIILIDSGMTEILVLDAGAQSYQKSLEVRKEHRISYLTGSDELIISHDHMIDLIDFESRNLLSQLELPFQPLEFVADSDTHMFGVKIDSVYRSSNDDGWSLASLYLISIDDNRQMFTQFHIIPYNKKVYFSPAGQEIAEVIPRATGSFRYDHLLSFEELVEQAKELIP